MTTPMNPGLLLRAGAVGAAAVLVVGFLWWTLTLALGNWSYSNPWQRLFTYLCRAGWSGVAVVVIGYAIGLGAGWWT